MTTDLLELKRHNFDEFIDTIPPGVKRLAEMVFSYFKAHSESFNYVLADGTIYIYLNDQDFRTTGSIVAYLNADFDTPPFKPYKNAEEDAVLGNYEVYLKLNQEILDKSGFFNEDDVSESTDDGNVEEPEADEGSGDQGIVEAPTMRKSDAEATEEVSHEEILKEFEYEDMHAPGDSGGDLSGPEDGEADDMASVHAPMSTPATEEEVQLYWDNMKVIARDIESEALDVMRLTHQATGVVVPLVFVRIGPKVVIRTFQDQPSFDEHFEAVRVAAEQTFLDASEVKGTKNNIQILF